MSNRVVKIDEEFEVTIKLKVSIKNIVEWDGIAESDIRNCYESMKAGDNEFMNEIKDVLLYNVLGEHDIDTNMVGMVQIVVESV